MQNGSVEEWYFPENAYNYYLSASAYTPLISLKFDNGTSIPTYDYRSLITPSFFAEVVPTLTKRHTAKQFVNEVVNLKDQLTTYSLVFQNTSVYPAVILAKGKGDCKDFGVLMASILEAGNMQANYSMKIQLVYVDAYNLSNPNTINHLILYINFPNGTGEFVDTTSILNHTTTQKIKGWYFNLTCNATSCQTTQTCQTGYIYGGNEVCHLECGGNGNYCSSGNYCENERCVACPSGTVIGNDGLCHATCGGQYTYCGTGLYCYNNRCVACSAGNVLGSDGMCHQACGTGYCNATASCYNNRCVSCPSGYYLGTDGECHLG